MLVTTIDALGLFLNKIMTAQCEGMGDVGSVKYEPALLPPCPTIKVATVTVRDPSTPFLSELSEIWHFKG